MRFLIYDRPFCKCDDLSEPTVVSLNIAGSSEVLSMGGSASWIFFTSWTFQKGQLLVPVPE